MDQRLIYIEEFLMKKISLLILFALGMVQLQASQEPPFTYHADVHFGQNFADENSKMRDDALYGIRGTVMLTPFYGLSLGYDRIDSIDIKESSGTVDLQRIYGLIEVDGEEQYHVVPYITFGAGYEILSHDVVANGHKYDISQAYLTGGLGFRYNFIPEISIFAEGNALWKTDTTDIAYTMLAGVMYHFNATTCDNTYVTERLKEKPKEKTTLHVGAVNAVSSWDSAPDRSAKRKAFFKKTKKTQPLHQVQVAEEIKPVKKSLVSHKVVKAKKVTPRPSKKKVVKKSVPYKGGYYIALGAFKTQKGLQTLLHKLDKKNIPYILKDSRSKKLTYVLAGVYPNAAKARQALKQLKKIQPDAYIRRMK
jgi:cell division septation protein DedD